MSGGIVYILTNEAMPDYVKIGLTQQDDVGDRVRPTKAVETIIDAVVMQLQHSPGTKIKVALDIRLRRKTAFQKQTVALFATMLAS